MPTLVLYFTVCICCELDTENVLKPIGSYVMWPLYRRCYQNYSKISYFEALVDSNFFFFYN